MKVVQLVNLVADALVIEKPVTVPVEPEKVAVVAEAKELEGYKILVVDDEPDVCEFLSMVLEDNGATVLTASDGEEGLTLARKESPDLITLDLSMPGMDGGKVFETLRKDPELSSTRVCIVSGRPELRRLIYERPVPPPEGYLDKPVTEETFLLNVRKILELTAAEKPEETPVN
jgi:two-component system alkaline phosphatase synthesis response regulator PhoP